MSRHSTVTAALAAVALLGLAGCASSDGSGAVGKPSGENKPSSALANLDTCKILTPQQIEQGGLTFMERIKQFDWEPGCMYLGDPVDVTVYKNTRYDAKTLGENGDWGSYEPTQVNGRQGATARVAGDTEDACSTVMSAGGGAIRVSVQAGDPLKQIDGCAESMKIAQQIEPNLPE